MAAPYNPPVKGENFIFAISLEDAAIPGSFIINPTLAAGDFNVDKDGAGFGALGTTPAVEPAATARIKVTLSATEMNADIVTFAAVDASVPKLWNDVLVTILTTA